MLRIVRAGLILVPLVQLAASHTPPAAPRVPRLVFVSRAPAADRALVPGLGPHGRTLATGGRLLVRDPDGALRPLLSPAALFDVSDPCVSWDARRIVFAGTPARDSAWRIYVVGSDGRGLRAITRADRALDLSPLGSDTAQFARYDDFDPCWLPDGRVCFASTRFPLAAETGGVLASNLFVIAADGTGMQRITTERNGGEEPTVDPVTGRIVYARWWFNRYLASENDSFGLTTDRARAVPSDTVDVWHAVSVHTDGGGIRLAGGDPRGRGSVMAYQPQVLGDGTLIGVRAEQLSLSPSGGRTSVQRFDRGFSEARALVGGGIHGAFAVSPAALPDGRLLVSLDVAGNGDFGLYVMNGDGTGLHRLLDLPRTLELDAVALAPRRRPPRLAPLQDPPLTSLPLTHVDQLHDLRNTFRFDCLNVFANAALDRPFPGAPRMQRNVRIRFFGVLARPAAQGGDSVVLVRESKVTPAGAVHEEDIPADTPLFEQLVDAEGRVLRSARGPAHVPGFNFGRFGSGTKCVGCHAGHSALPVPPSAGLAKWVNASPSADISATSEAPGTAGAVAVADRRTRGAADRVAWVSAGETDQTLRLRWRWPIEVQAVVLYAVRRDVHSGTDLQVGECELRFRRDGRELERKVVRGPLSPAGTRAECSSIRIDELEIIPSRVSGRVLHRPAVGLAEVETIARLLEN
jgi:hypothetical protein